MLRVPVVPGSNEGHCEEEARGELEDGLAGEFRSQEASGADGADEGVQATARTAEDGHCPGAQTKLAVGHAAVGR